MSRFTFRHLITGAGLGTLLMLSSLMTILYLDYRGAVNPDEMGTWISVCALGSLGLCELISSFCWSHCCSAAR